MNRIENIEHVNMLDKLFKLAKYQEYSLFELAELVRSLFPEYRQLDQAILESQISNIKAAN